MAYDVDYVWQDGLLTHQNMIYYLRITSKNETRVVEIPFSAKFVYDESNTPVGCLVNGEAALAFVRNLQGDIIAVVNQEGTALLEYSYDPWGKVTITHNGENLTEQERQIIAVLCPFAYRGYNYDYTTGLYYLQSRYYNPEWGRFLNVDDTNILLSTQGENLGANLFAYCNNDPVNNADYTGYEGEGVTELPIILAACFAYVVVQKDMLYNENLIDMSIDFTGREYITLSLTYLDGEKKVYQQCKFQTHTAWEWYTLVAENYFSPIGQTFDTLLIWSDWFPPGVDNYTGLKILDTIMFGASVGSIVKELTSSHHTKLEQYIIDEVERFGREGSITILIYVYQYETVNIGFAIPANRKILYPY